MAQSTKCETIEEYKLRKSFADRLEDTESMKLKNPNYVPVLLQRAKNEKYLPMMTRMKHVIPNEYTMSQFYCLIRKKLSLMPSQTLFMFVNNKGMVAMSTAMVEIYQHHKEDDGCLYITYATEDTFGMPIRC